jgi:uncharacterized protein
MINKIVIGTANFGLSYGINNSKGKVSGENITKILLLAEESGVSIIDTAQAYGDAEERLGTILKKIKSNLKTITKLKPSFSDKVSELVDSSLCKLGVKNLYGVLFHEFKDFLKDKGVYSELKYLKQQGKINKIGFSVYYPSEIEFLFNNNIDFDIIQFPYNVFDRRFDYLLNELKARNVEIHTRSVFLQGLVFMEPEKLPDFLKGAKKSITELLRITKKSKMSISKLCLNFVLRNQYIDKVVIGVDSFMQFEQNLLDIGEASFMANIGEQLDKLRIEDEKIILPFNWI